MESPVPALSEVNVRTLSRAFRASKKSLSRYETASVDSPLLGARSVSLNTLPAQGNVVYKPRMAQLQTLEAKMASIEVSLSTGTASRKRTEKLAQFSKEVLKEIELLKIALQDKDKVILRLRTHISDLCGQLAGSWRIANYNSLSEDRSMVQQRIDRIQQDVESRRLAVKNLRLALDSLDLSDSNIDMRIHQAELESQLESEELNILNLQEEALHLTARLDQPQLSQKSQQSSIYRWIPPEMTVSVVPVCLHYDVTSPCFILSQDEASMVEWAQEGTGLRKGDRMLEINQEICWYKSREELCEKLTSQDGEEVAIVVLRITPPLPQRRNQAKEILNLKEELAVVTDKLESQLRENQDITVVFDRTKKDREGLKSENIRLSHRISYLEEQVLEMGNQVDDMNARLKHSSTVNSDSSIQVFQKGAHITTVPLGGGSSKHKEKHDHIPVKSTGKTSKPVKKDTVKEKRDRSVERKSASSYSMLDTKHKRLAESKSCTSLNGISSRPTKPHSTHSTYSAHKVEKPKPVPPKKPDKLAIQRATSLQSMDGAVEVYSRKRNHKETKQTAQTWPSIEKNLDTSSTSSSQKRISKKTSSHVMGKWPSLQGFKVRGSSMSLNETNKKAEQWC